MMGTPNVSADPFRGRRWWLHGGGRMRTRRLEGGSAAGSRLRRAEDAGWALLLFLLFALLAVGRDDDALARGQLAPVEASLDLFRVERLALEQGVREAIELVAVLF